MKHLNKSGFTLIELLAVIVILSIILIITVPAVINNLSSTRKSAIQSNADIAAKYYNDQLDMVLIGMPPKNFVVDATVNTELNKINAQAERCISVEEAGILGLSKKDHLLNMSCTISGTTLSSSCYSNIENYSTVKWNNSGNSIVKLVGKANGKFDSLIAISNVSSVDMSHFSTESEIAIENTTAGKEIRNLKIYGNSTQSSSPSFDTPATITSVGDYDPTTGKYKIPITVRSKNLFDRDNFLETFTEYFTKKPSIVTFEGKESLKIYGQIDSTGREIEYMKGKFKENTQYTFSFEYYDVNPDNYVTSGIYIVAYYTDGSYDYVLNARSLSTAGVWYNRTLTSDAGKTIDCLKLSYNYHTPYTYFYNFQIEEGMSKTEYEPYSSQTYNIYLNEPLRKVDNYTDYIDFENNAVVRNTKSVTLNGSESWINGGTLDNTFRAYVTMSDMAGVAGGVPLLSDKVTPILSGTSNNDNEHTQVSGNNLFLRVLKGRLGTIDISGFKGFLASNPVTVVYPLATPTAYESISLPKLKTVDGSTIISVDTSVESTVTGSY